MLMLAVERQQARADVAQLGHGGRAAAEVGAGTPVRAHAARERELLGVCGQALAELLSQAVGKVEDTLDVRLGGARAHDPRSRAPAEQQVERVSEHGLARAGLAGEHVQPRRKPQLGLLDQQ